MKTKQFFQQVSLNEIQPNEANVRECFDNASIQELADSIQNSGLIILPQRFRGKYKI